MNNKGFTLVELLATIVVLGIVTSITIVTVNVSMTDSKKKSEEVFESNVIKAVESYISANSSKYSGCTSTSTSTNPNCTFEFSKLITDGYLSKKNVTNPNNETKCYDDNTKVTVTAQYDSNDEFNKYCFKLSLSCLDEVNTCE